MEKYGNITIIESESRFKKIDKSLIENHNIDCLTLGIYAKLIVLGKKWQLNIKGLRKHLGLSDEKVRKSLSLLEREGYILRTPVRNEKGQLVGWNYTIYSTPINEDDRSQAGVTKQQKRDDEKPTPPKTDHSDNGGDNNNRLNEQIDLTEEEKKDKYNKKKEATTCDYDEIKSKWEELNPNLPSIRTFSEKRKNACRILLKNNNATIDDIYKAFEIISVCSFCNGKNDRRWVATLDWILNDTKGCFNRLLEGAYAFNEDEKCKVKRILGLEFDTQTQQSDKTFFNGVEYK